MSDDGKKEFALAMSNHRSQYQSVMGLIREQFDEIELSVKSGVPIDVITEQLKQTFNIQTTRATVKSCLSRHRKALKSSGKTINDGSKQTYQSPSIPQSGSSDTDQIDWNETEKLVGYRLEECIRPYVQVVDGNIVRNFKKGTVYNAEIRKAIQRLRNVVDPD